jgi:hypothetical protein
VTHGESFGRERKPKTFGELYANQERKQEMRVVDSLIDAADAAMNLGDQMLWEEIEQIAQRTAKVFNVPDEKCAKCGLVTSYVHWVLGQGCPCAAAGYTSEESG